MDASTVRGNLSAIADAIRLKNGETGLYYLSTMASAIASLPNQNVTIEYSSAATGATVVEITCNDLDGIFQETF